MRLSRKICCTGEMVIKRAWIVGLLTASLALAVVLVACGGGSEGASPTNTPQGQPPAREMTPLVVSTDLAVGENRFAFGLLDSGNTPIENARVHLRFFRVMGEQEEMKFEADATYRQIETEFEHRHADGQLHVHSEARGIYLVSPVTFDAAGPWGAKLAVILPDGKQIDAEFFFQVHEQSSTPAVGAPAPQSRQRTVADVQDITEIDSSDPPRPELHDITIADAIAQQKPFVVTFSTPAFCRSQVCGPVLEVTKSALEPYSDSVELIHIEPYDLNMLRTRGQYQIVDVVREWGLTSEPYTFVVDKDGRIAAKFEGIVTKEELDAAIQQVASSGTASQSQPYGY